MCERAAVFTKDYGEPLLHIYLSARTIRIKAKGVNGWCTEQAVVGYKGPPLHFVICPNLFKKIAQKYPEVLISKTRMKAVGDEFDYVTVLSAAEPSC